MRNHNSRKSRFIFTIGYSEFSGIVGDTEDAVGNLTITWHSDKDGLIGATVPTTDGMVNFSTSALTPNQHSIQMQVEDRSGGSCIASVEISITGASIIQSLEIQPNPAYTNTNLQAETEVFDPENDPISLALRVACKYRCIQHANSHIESPIFKRETMSMSLLHPQINPQRVLL